MGEEMSGLTAGRELDSEIAEKVMGYSGRVIVRRGRSLKSSGEPLVAFRISPSRFECGAYETHWLLDGTKLYCGKPFSPRFAPHFSTDIAAAWLVVERLAAISPQQDFHLEHMEGAGWTASCCFNRADGGWDGWRNADTAPLAICLAALQAVSA